MTTTAPGRPAPDRIVGQFEPIAGSQGAFSLAVLTGRWPIAGRQLFARVGAQPLTSVIPFMGGGGFVGRLDRPPHEGDRLYVRYSGSLEVATPVVYRVVTLVASATEAAPRLPADAHTAEPDLTKLREFVDKALTLIHGGGAAGEIVALFAGDATRLAILAEGAGLVGGMAFAVAVPLIMYDVFTTGLRTQMQKGSCYGFMWAALGPDWEPKAPYLVNIRDEGERKAFQEGVDAARKAVQKDSRLRDAIRAAVVYEAWRQQKGTFTKPEARVLNRIWEQVHDKDSIWRGTAAGVRDTHLNWDMPGSAPYERRLDDMDKLGPEHPAVRLGGSLAVDTSLVYPGVTPVALAFGVSAEDSAAQKSIKSWALLPHQMEDSGGALVPLNPSQLDPGFLQANGTVKTAKPLQDLLDTVIAERAFKGMSIVLVDLTRDPKKPELAVHRHDQMVAAASIPKIAAMLAAFQIRCDLRALAASSGARTAKDLFKAARSNWLTTQTAAAGGKDAAFLGIERRDALLLQKGKAISIQPTTWTQTRTPGVDNGKIVPGKWIASGQAAHADEWKVPALETMFTVEASTNPVGVSFAPAFLTEMELMIGHSKNSSAAKCIRQVGYLTIGSVLMQSGLVDPRRGGGLWLRSDYGGECLKKTELTVNSKKHEVCSKHQHHGHTFAPFGGSSQAATTISLAAFFTLMAQNRLVSAAASAEMKDLMDKSKEPGRGNRSPLTETLTREEAGVPVPTTVYSKLGLLDEFSDVVLVERTVAGRRLRYVAAALSAELDVITKLGERLEACIRRNNGL